jgi:hypothetical protein
MHLEEKLDRLAGIVAFGLVGRRVEYRGDFDVRETATVDRVYEASLILKETDEVISVYDVIGFPES